MKQAFPRPVSEFGIEGKTDLAQDGMSLLEYYAGQALIGELRWMAENGLGCVDPDEVPASLAESAFVVAEAMVKEAEKRK